MSATIMDEAGQVTEENITSDLTRIAWPLLLRSHSDEDSSSHTRIPNENSAEKAPSHIQINGTSEEINNFLNSSYALSITNDRHNNNNNIKNNITNSSSACLSASSIVQSKENEIISERKEVEKEKGKSTEEVEVINPATFVVISRASSTTSSTLHLSRFHEDLPSGHNIPAFLPTTNNFHGSNFLKVSKSNAIAPLISHHQENEGEKGENINEETINGRFDSERDKKFNTSNTNHNNIHNLDFLGSHGHNTTTTTTTTTSNNSSSGDKRINKQPVQLFYLENKSVSQESDDKHKVFRNLPLKIDNIWTRTIILNKYTGNKATITGHVKKHSTGKETKNDADNYRKKSLDQQQYWSYNNSETTTISTLIRDSRNGSASDYRKVSNESSRLKALRLKETAQKNRLKQNFLKVENHKQRYPIRSFIPQFLAAKYRREKTSQCFKKNLQNNYLHHGRHIGLPNIHKQQQPTLKPQATTTSTTATSTEKTTTTKSKLEAVRSGITASLLSRELKPINGMIKTYADSNRNFSRPYSAKTVFFYKDGDEYFTGLRVPITKVRYRTMDSLMDRLNESIPLPFGVRRLHTPYGKTPISSVDQLQHLGKYVATSSKMVRGLDLDALERRKRKRDENSTRSHFSTATSVTSVRGKSTFKHENNANSTNVRNMSQQGTSRLKTSIGQYGLTYLPAAKQMFFVLNGRPSTVYRTVLNPLKMRDLDALLEEVSEGLRTAIFHLFSYDGERIQTMEQLLALKEARVLAVPRHQRPILQGGEAFPQLPPIFNWTTTITRPTASVTTNFAPNRGSKPRRRFSTTSSASTSKLFTDEQLIGTDDNTDDTALDNIDTGAKSSYDKTTNQPSFRHVKIPPTNLDSLPKFPYNSSRVEQDGLHSVLSPLEPVVPNGNINSDNSNSVGSNTNTNTNTVDSDSGRPRSALDLAEEMNVVTDLKPGFLHPSRKRRSLSDPTKSSIKPQLLSKKVINPKAGRDLKLFRSKSLKRMELYSPLQQKTNGKQPSKVFGKERSLSFTKDNTLRHLKSQNIELKSTNRIGTPQIDTSQPNPTKYGALKSRLQTENTVHSKIPKLQKAVLSSGNNVSLAETKEFPSENDDEDSAEDDYPEHEEMRESYFQNHDIDMDKEFEELEREHSNHAMEDEGGNALEPVKENDEKHSFQDDSTSEVQNDQTVEFELNRMHTIREEESVEENQKKKSELPVDSLSDIVSELNAESSNYFPSMAATIIQSRFRGFLARKKVNQIRFSDTVQIIEQEDRANKTTLTNDDSHRESRNENPTTNDESGDKMLKNSENVFVNEIITNVNEEFVEKSQTQTLTRTNISPTTNVNSLNDEQQPENRSSPPKNGPKNVQIPIESLAIEEEFVHNGEMPTNSEDTEILHEPTSPFSDVQDGEIHVGALLDPEQDLTARMWNSPQNPRLTYTYTVTVKTGNRWAADTEADLFLIMHGNSLKSERIVLRQEYVNWLQSSEPKFRQNQTDLFRIEVPAKLGIIRRITIGHEHAGYGAGIFVERILITEEDENEFADRSDFDEDGDVLDAAQSVGTGSGPRQFLFLCNKWLDSGQVDGKLERNFRLSAFCYVNSTPISARRTKGRWEFVFHNGTASGQGGTTSNLRIIGYGTRGQSTTSDVYDTRMNKVPSESLIQVDFGNIGDLLKVRVEIDGVGKSPDYFLNFVVMNDLDTEERFVVMCGKWLRWKNSARGAQPFRELLAFHMGVEPLPLICYEGKLRIAPSKIQCFQPMVEVEFHGDLGESGIFTVSTISDENENIENENENSKEINFKVEAVSIGRVYGARIYFQPTKIGAELFEGFCALQNIFENLLTDSESTASDWLVSSVVLRESLHTPYRYVLTQRKLLPQQKQEDDLAAVQPYVMDLISSEMEGVATRAAKRDKKKRVESNWVLSMLLGGRSTLLPEVTLCGERNDRAVLMRNLDPAPVDNIISYQLRSSKVGVLRKVRVSADGKKRLNMNAEESAETTPNFVSIQKIRLCDTVNGDELRFPSADIELGANSVYEFSAIWPDFPPNSIVIYVVRIQTGNSDILHWDFGVRLNIRGQFGDVGQRALVTRATESNSESNPNSVRQFFQQNSQSAFEFEAVSIGELKSAEITIDSQETNFSWECKELIVTDSETQANSVFKFPRRFSARFKHQTAVAQKLSNGS